MTKHSNSTLEIRPMANASSPQTASPVNNNGRSLAFLVGMEQYNFHNTLQTPIHDAMELQRVLDAHYGFNTDLTIDPTGADFRTLLGRIKETVCTPNDKVLIYIAGHGIARDSEKGPRGFIVPVDGDQHENTWISMTELVEVLESLPCRHLLLVLDCCFAGAVRWAGHHRGLAFVDGTQSLSRQQWHMLDHSQSYQVLTSASHRQFAQDVLLGDRGEETGKGHSPFAQCLLEALSGEADYSGDKIITAAEIQAFMQNRMSRQAAQSQQTGLFHLNKHETGDFLFYLDGFDPGDLRLADYENPYKALQAYEQSDSALFFGRKKAIAALEENTDLHPLVVVVGASGSGKSSLVKAGLLPKWTRKTGKKALVIRPGRKPLESLKDLDSFDLLVVDQLEELITQAEKETDIDAFYLALVQLIQQGKKVIVTARIDFEAQLKRAAISDLWERGRWVVTPFTPEELREIITAPSLRVGRLIRPLDLIDEIVNEVVHFPGALPLLSFTMYELYARCQGDPFQEITREDYQELEGVTGALRSKADQLWDSLSPIQQSAMKQVILRMVSLAGEEPAGQPVQREELQFDEPVFDAAVEEIEHLLVANRLAATKNGSTMGALEPAHDALVRSWQKIYDWRREVGDEAIKLHTRLRAATEDYVHGGKKPSMLWAGDPRLGPVLALKLAEKLRFNQREAAFVEASAARKKLRSRLALMASALLITLALGSGLLFVQYKYQSISQLLQVQTEKLAAEALTKKTEIQKAQKERQAWVEQGRRLMKEEDYSQAQAYFQRVIDQDANNPDALRLIDSCFHLAKLKLEYDSLLLNGQRLEAKGRPYFYLAMRQYRAAKALGYKSDVSANIAYMSDKLKKAFEEFIRDGDARMLARRFDLAQQSYIHALHIIPHDREAEKKLSCARQRRLCNE